MELTNQPHLKPLLVTLVQMHPTQLSSISIEEIAIAAQSSRSSVKRKLGILRKLGALETKRDRVGRGSKYRIVLHPSVYYVVRSRA